MVVKSINQYNCDLYMPGSEADDFCFDLEELEPIPLTPEILEAAGFERGCPYSKNGWTAPEQAFFFEDDNNFDPREMSSGRVFSVEIKHLHQLQNLYFALTGTELTIKNLVDV